jgi:hypothetical protein
MQTVFDSAARDRLCERLQSLQPDARRRWGTMTAPEMICHLTDQMRHTLGLAKAEPRQGPLRWPFVKWASIYLLPWPKGRIKGPPEAYVSKPGSWVADIEHIQSLLDRFVDRDPRGPWPEHALFGPMSHRDWGVFIHKHFDYHLRQFGS